MKIAKVILDIQNNVFSRAYSYAICDGLDLKLDALRQKLISNLDFADKDKFEIQVGCIVAVPFGKQTKAGFVVDICDASSLDIDVNKLKPILFAASLPYFDKNNVSLAKFISKKYLASLASCLRLFIPPGANAKLKKNGDKYEFSIHRYRPLKTDFINKYLSEKFLNDNNYENFELTQGQNCAIDTIKKSLDDEIFKVYVIDGVTGSGKTEVYLRLIDYVTQKSKTACVLVPEISLTPQTVSRFYQRFGDAIAVLHSKMTNQELYNQYQKIYNGDAKIVIGARSALFSPLKNIGIIVIDEEHENSYKQDKTPRYNTRDCAVELARLNNACLILGSATPSIESLHKANNCDGWQLINMPERTNNAKMPNIEIADMGLEFKGGYKNLFSRKLEKEIIQQLSAGNKVVLFHNRRGYANYMFCRSCGFTPKCPNCSTSLTYHQRYRVYDSSANMQTYKAVLNCHHCGHIQEVYSSCPECDSPYIAKYGAGTQSVEDQLSAIISENALFNARIIRMDSDTTSAALSHQTYLDEFAKPGPAVLLGTQMITKGLDFEDVTLVGVILADTNLTLPDFRSAERTFDLILQVAGRAGRANLPGKVIVQTYMPDAESIMFAANYNKQGFLQNELAKRQLLKLPPYTHLANIVLLGSNENELSNISKELENAISDYIQKNSISNLECMPPTACVLAKIRNNYRYHILLKCNNSKDLSSYIDDILSKFKSKSNIKINIDIDPVSLL